MLPLSHLLLVVLTLGFSSLAQARGWWMWTPGDHVDDVGYHPEQPVPFSHKLHAGDRQISCQFCHSAARRSITAGIPSVATCRGCHQFVNTEAEAIKYVNEKFDKNEPIHWVKVHDLPDYVRFSHKVHLLAKDKDGKPLLGETPDAVCTSCHGPVKEMTTAEQWAPLQMGWCIECHSREKVPAENGKPAIKYASVTCNTCHY